MMTIGCRTDEAVRGGMRVAILVVGLTTMVTGGCALRSARHEGTTPAELRHDAIARAQVWSRTNVSAMNIRRGPAGRSAPAPEAMIDCTYVPQELDGKTPKFLCKLPQGEVIKVKYGRDNGEVYAEVAASRLLWALGFGADEVYPVRVRCHGCPDVEGKAKAGDTVFDVATMERRRRGRRVHEEADEGWGWPELDRVDPARGGASLAERDALKLLAVMLQHTDSKPDQQRLVCDGRTRRQACARPFMFIDDTGKTFGKANAFNRDGPGSVNLEAWSGAKVWADATGCRANLERSATGTLEYPVISDAGRRFLMDRLNLLTDRQLRDLFTVARFPLRAEVLKQEEARDVDAWLRAFRDKVTQISERSCSPSRAAAVATSAARE